MQDRDADESDVFLLSGAEDLVPLPDEDQPDKPRTVDGVDYSVQRYRPRIEGLFARIERWTNEKDPTDVFWRSISKDNVMTWYGKTPDSRIFDPSDPGRIFSWLICESYDDKGNVIVYGYKEEDSEKINLSQAHERNRTDQTRNSNRYLKRIRYGNRAPYLPELLETAPWPSPPGAAATDGSADWLFEVVFDYDDHDPDRPLPNEPARKWPCRNDPFSSYRAGFEVRTYRLCQRVLMFHHFPDEKEVGASCLVRSTDFTYSYEKDPIDPRNPVFSFLLSATQSGYKAKADGSYLTKSLPPLEFEYSQATIQEEVQEVDPKSLENLPYGLDGANYQWVDLDGEGLSGILTRQAGAWFYKRNLGRITIQRDGGEETTALFAPMEPVASQPSLSGAGQQFLDLAGDGQVDLVQFEGPLSGYYERTQDGEWSPFVPFESAPSLAWDDPNLRFVDLTGDGHADILITEDEVFTWYPSLAEAGFGPAERVRQALDEEKGPRLVFADGTQSIHLADISGDGLTDLVRIRNGEVCYWPNLGYGRFGARVTMGNSPHFDAPDQFEGRRVQLADIDGSGVTDIIYLGSDGVRLYFNQSGNRWSEARKLAGFPHTDNLSSVTAVDLLGNGTACLVWSSSLPGDGRRPMYYVDLMGGQKPHLLVKAVNNLGAETHVHYASSTKFYLEDKAAGKPWITRLPFPVHVVERVETYDRISRNRFVTRYAYHHGYFDGHEREFRGFGMVEQWDTEEFAALSKSGDLPATNIDEASHVPPALTRTWFHTGVYLGRDRVSNFFAGLLDGKDAGEYYREPDLDDEEAREFLLDDTVLPAGLTVEEEREACRALKGSMLRQEVYALDGTDKQIHPYTVTEQNFTIERLQTRAGYRHGVFFVHPREAISYHYERDQADPRVSHALTLEVDDFGNVRKSLAIGYGRRHDDPDPLLTVEDRNEQKRTLMTYTDNGFTNAIDDRIKKPDGTVKYPDDYRTPLPCETRTYELTGFEPANDARRFGFEEWVKDDFALLKSALEIDYEQTADRTKKQRRLIEHVRTRYRKNDLSGLLPQGTVESLALPGETYKLAFTPGLLSSVYRRKRAHQPPENLLPDPAGVLPVDVPGGRAADRGGYVDLDGDGNWWVSSGRVFYSPDAADTPPLELAYARQHFFLPHRYRDPFHTDQASTETLVGYDAYDLLVQETRDALENYVTVGERDVDPTRPLVSRGQDYRVLQPALVMDPNRNCSAVAFDALGMVVGTAVMGKPEEDPRPGDSLEGFDPDLTDATIAVHLQDPLSDPHAILNRASTRLIYDLFAYERTKDQADPQPAVVYTLLRESHDADLGPGQKTKVQHGFSYSDGFGREIQKKIQAEPGPLIENGPNISPRWVGSGWTIFNNKGKPVRQYEPFFSATHSFEFGVQVGVSPILFYDPVGRVIATLHPNHTYEKVVFDPWRQAAYDANDTVTSDPRDDDDTSGFVSKYFEQVAPQPDDWQTWLEQRGVDPLAPPKDSPTLEPETKAAVRTLPHGHTPTVAHFDNLGRPFLTVAHNRFKRKKPDGTTETVEERYPTRVLLDIEGNQREVIDAKGRVVMRYDYDLLGNRIHQASMEAGERWALNDVVGNQIRAWDSRGFVFRTAYDPLRRPLRSFVTGAKPANPNQVLLTERLVYGEQHPEAELRNLRGSVYLHLDQAGAVTNEAHDFKGNLLHASRRLGREYKKVVPWGTVDAVLPASAAAKLDPAALEAALTPRLEADTFGSRTTYDALNRPVTLRTPDDSVIRPGYNEANLLQRVDANLRGVATSTTFVANIDYDAKGQRTRIDYGNGASTFYAYDPLTFRLTHLLTRRDTIEFPGDCPQPPPAGWPGCQMQNLHNAYDPVGNIVHIRDDAQQKIYYRNKRVEPSADYIYDAVYRLIQATGREHLGLTASGKLRSPTPTSHTDAPRVSLAHPGDGKAMGRYTEKYSYDQVGNIMKLVHTASSGGWTRSYVYDEPSLIGAGKNNRLTSTKVGAVTDSYSYDAHGNMIKMPRLPLMRWDHRDQVQATSKQVRTAAGTPETTYYVYDAAGQRVRKVTEKQAAPGETPKPKEERVYLGGFEIYREYNGDGSSVTLERETLHITDEKRRIALVETRTQGNDGSPAQLSRYQFGNHLGSSVLELGDQAQFVSYEEYYPYGSTSYQAVRKDIEVPRKRYRYAGKERDEESGLYCYGARYYAPWMGTWISADPAGMVDGTNLYLFVGNNPIRFTDPNGTQYVDVTKARRLPGETDDQLIARLVATGRATPLSTMQNQNARPAPEGLAAEVIMGDFYEGKPTAEGMVANVVVGLTPIAGQVADARDTIAAVDKIVETPTSGAAWASLGLAVVGWVPGMDWVKGGGKAAKKLVTETVTETLPEGASATKKLVAGADKGVAIEKATGKAAKETTVEVAQRILDQKFSSNKAILSLWNDAVQAAKAPVDLTTTEGARTAYNNTLKRFLTRLTDESDPVAAEARKVFEESGFRFLRDEKGRLKKNLPILDLPDVEAMIDPKRLDMLRASGQHLTKIMDDPSKALDPDNLVWMIGLDNTLMDITDELAEKVRKKTVDQLSK